MSKLRTRFAEEIFARISLDRREKLLYVDCHTRVLGCAACLEREGLIMKAC
jgi:hypothetical protein